MAYRTTEKKIAVDIGDSFKECWAQRLKVQPLC